MLTAVQIKPDHRVGLAFGSYGWAPLGPKNINTVLKETGFGLPVDTHAVNWIPSQEKLDEARELVGKLVEA